MEFEDSKDRTATAYTLLTADQAEPFMQYSE